MVKNEKNSFYYSDNSGNVQNIEDDKHYVGCTIIVKNLILQKKI